MTERQMIELLLMEFGDHHYHGCPADRVPEGECNCYAGALCKQARALLAAGASEGQEPVAYLRKDEYGNSDTVDSHIYGAFPVYGHPSAEIAALRERIAGMEKDAGEIERRALERAAQVCEGIGRDGHISMLPGAPRCAHAIRALIEGASSDKEWISVADRLPAWTDGRASKTKVYVLARTVGGVEKECGFYLAGPDGAWDDYDYSPLHRVTHWKPIASSAASKEESAS